MTDLEKTDETNALAQKKPELPAKQELSPVLSGAEKLLDGQTHTGIAVLVGSDGKPSTLMIPDVTNIEKGQPVYITKPIRINGEGLKNFLSEKGVSLPEAVTNLIEKTEISCEAFYYTKDGPLLMMFALKLEAGLIETLTGDKDLGKLFDIRGASVRVFRCSKENESFSVLKNYCAELSE